MLRSLLASTASNGSRFTVTTVITLVMTPVYIRELGNYDYGIWEIMISVVGYLGLLDMGLRPTISRFTAYFRKGETPRDQNILFATSLCLMAAVGVLVSIALFTWSVTIPGVLAPDDESAPRYALLIQLFAMHVLLTFPYFSIESTYEGRLFYTTKNNISIAHSIISATFVFHAIHHFDPLLLLISVNLVMTASKLSILFSILRLKSYGGYRFRPALFSTELTIRMLRFGSKALLQGIAGQVGKRADAVLIGIFLGPQKIVFFSLARTLLDRVSSLTQIAGHAFMPAFSTMHGAGDREQMARYFFVGTKYIFALKAASCLGLGVVGDAFISLWIGPEYGEAARPLIWLLVAGALIGGSLPLHNRLLVALDRHGWLAILYSIRALLNVALTIALIPVLGLVGVALAGLLAQIAIVPFIWRAVFRNLDASPGEYLRDNLLPVFTAAAGMAGVVATLAFVTGLDTWTTLITVVVVGAVLFPVFFLVLATDANDRAFLTSVCRRALSRG